MRNSQCNVLTFPLFGLILNIRTYNSLCLWKWSEFVEIASGKLQMTDVQIKEMCCVSTLVSAHILFSLLINIKLTTQCLSNSLHNFSLVCYNVIIKKTCLILQQSKHLNFSHPKTNVVGVIEIITVIDTHTWKLWI